MVETVQVWVNKVSLTGMENNELVVARYKVGKMRQSHIVEALSVHSGVGLKLVGSDLMADLKKHLVGMKTKRPM